MLSSLHIENIAVIKTCDVDFEPGFCVLTGETGAGKSILIDSIGLLLGARFSKDLIRAGETRATVSATFTGLSDQMRAILSDLGMEDDEELYLVRTVSEDGKSVTKCNGRTIPVSVQRQLSEHLITIHGQHDNGAFLNEENHVLFLDGYAGLDGDVREYGAEYDKLTQIGTKITSLRRDEKEKERMLEMLAFQIRDIESVKPKAGEEDELLAEKKRLQNMEKIEKSVHVVYGALYADENGLSASDLLQKASDSIAQLEGIMDEAASFSEQLTQMQSTLYDIAERVRDFGDTDDSEPAEMRLDRIEDRLEKLTKLKRKYGSTVEEVLEYYEKTKAELETVRLSDELIEQYKNEYREQYKTVKRLADALTEKRRAAADRLCEQLQEQFSYLDMGKVRFSVNIEPRERPGQDGMDTVTFLIATNPGEPFKPLAKIASGGELSRVTLAAKCVLSERESGVSLIFDEVDTGVSGKTSHKIGTKLRSLSHAENVGQVFCVTHSAQVAAQADAHYLISKQEADGRVYTTVTALDPEGRVSELARILGGMEITEASLAGAKDLLSRANQ